MNNFKNIIIAICFTVSSFGSDKDFQCHETLRFGASSADCAKDLKLAGYSLLSDGTGHGAWGAKSVFPADLVDAARELGLKQPYGSQVWAKGDQILRLHFSARGDSGKIKPALFWVEITRQVKK